MNPPQEDLGLRLAAIKGATLIKSFCYTCPWQCPTEILVRDGQVVYHKGNPESPEQHRLALCEGHGKPVPDARSGSAEVSDAADQSEGFHRASSSAFPGTRHSPTSPTS